MTVLFAIGALVAKYKLETFRVQIQAEASRRTGSDLQVGNVIVNGLRGLRVDELNIDLAPRNGPRCRIQAPSAYIYIDLVDLLYGQVTIDRILLDQAVISVEVNEDEGFFHEGGATRWAGNDLLAIPAFRVTGRDCELTLKPWKGAEALAVHDLSFDIARMTESPDLSARLEGVLESERNSRIEGRVRYSSASDFDARIQLDELTAADVAQSVQDAAGIVEAGSVSLSLRVAGYPSDTWIVSCTAPFENVRLHSQPEFLNPLSGVLTALASYDVAQKQLHVTAAHVKADQLRGTVSGDLSFDGDVPSFNLKLQADQWPVTEILNLLTQQRLQDLGTLDVALEESRELRMTLQGTAREPVITAMADAARGTVSFDPRHVSFPRTRLSFSHLHMAWDSKSNAVTGAMTVEDGTLHYAPLDVTADHVSGAVIFEHPALRVEPFSANVNGNSVAGRLHYDYASKEGALTAAGTVAGLEQTPVHTLFKDTTLSGSAHIELTGLRKNDHYELDARVDAGQAGIAYGWWFNKPAGIGAAGRVMAKLIPRKAITLEVDGEVASTKLTAKANLAYAPAADRKWRATEVTAQSPSLDVVTIGKCLRLPYQITGGTGTDGRYHWQRPEPGGKNSVVHAGARLGAVELLPQSGQVPFRFTEAVLDVEMNNAEPATGTVTLAIAKADVPAFGQVWFVPLRTDPELIARFPSTPRDWTYQLQADELALPPWQGTKFTGAAYTTETTGGLTHYGATVEGGDVRGAYHNDKTSNAYQSSVTFRNVPTSYFLKHLNYPPILTGLATGDITYGIDRDDPGTLQGTGTFDVRDGMLDTSFFFSQLQGNLQDSGMAALPSALPFDLVHAELGFHKDAVNTPKIQLLSKGLSMEAGGVFIRGGDMNYDLSVAVSPETARKIPILMESFNIEGHRLSQQDIKLAFKITGPTFNPKGQLAGLPPASVTFVSGALGITSEAVKVIDTPRRILLDLLKMGGGILGAQNR